MSDFNSNLAMAMNELQSMRVDTQNMMQALQPANVIGSGASVSVANPYSISNPGPLSGNITTAAHQQPFDYKPIQGEMLVVKKTISMQQWEDIPHDVIKKDMMRQLVEEMYSSKHIEFTMIKDPTSHDMVRIAARMFVVPDSQVRLLRENGY